LNVGGKIPRIHVRDRGDYGWPGKRHGRSQAAMVAGKNLMRFGDGPLGQRRFARGWPDGRRFRHRFLLHSYRRSHYSKM